MERWGIELVVGERVVAIVFSRKDRSFELRELLVSNDSYIVTPVDLILSELFRGCIEIIDALDCPMRRPVDAGIVVEDPL